MEATVGDTVTLQEVAVIGGAGGWLWNNDEFSARMLQDEPLQRMAVLL